MSGPGKSPTTEDSQAKVFKGKEKAPDQPQDVSMDEDDDSSDTGAEEEVCFLRPCLWSSMGQPN